MPEKGWKNWCKWNTNRCVNNSEYIWLRCLKNIKWFHFYHQRGNPGYDISSFYSEIIDYYIIFTEPHINTKKVASTPHMCSITIAYSIWYFQLLPKNYGPLHQLENCVNFTSLCHSHYTATINCNVLTCGSEGLSSRSLTISGYWVQQKLVYQINYDFLGWKTKMRTIMMNSNIWIYFLIL